MRIAPKVNGPFGASRNPEIRGMPSVNLSVLLVLALMIPWLAAVVNTVSRIRIPVERTVYRALRVVFGTVRLNFDPALVHAKGYTFLYASGLTLL